MLHFLLVAPALVSAWSVPSPAARDASQIAEQGFAVRWVRNVSPNKDMYCASFRAPSSRKRARTE